YRATFYISKKRTGKKRCPSNTEQLFISVKNAMAKSTAPQYRTALYISKNAMAKSAAPQIQNGSKFLNRFLKTATAARDKSNPCKFSKNYLYFQVKSLSILTS
ncbi:MAG: hypothetical protein IJD28_03170, partial [Deferribacterales bacterium]|nr:hypothetical protein [Deferribacterales bacterium]